MTSRLRPMAALLAGVSLAVACAASPAPVAPPPPPPPPPPQLPAGSPPSSPAPLPPPPTSAPAPPSTTAAAPHAAPAAPPAAPKKATDTRAWASRWPKAWSDPRVVAAIADDCEFVPATPKSSEPDSFGDEDVFACKLPFEQACFTTPCGDESDACKNDCEHGCTACGATCANQCGSCEAACNDAACRLACAKTTATCRQACARTMDRCATGTCAQASVACNASLSHGFAANHCEARCETYHVCTRRCGYLEGGAPNTPCRQPCENALEPGFAPCLHACEVAGGSPVARARCSRACTERFPCNSVTCELP